MQLRSLLGICLVLVPGQAFAQGAVAGFARDGRGTAMPGVSVELVQTERISEPSTAVTDAAGRYEIRNVPPGTYALSFRLPGFSTFRRDGIAVVERMPVTVNAVLVAAPIAETHTYRPHLPPSSVPPSPSSGQSKCLHGDTETQPEYQRRSDAHAAMQMIAFVIAIPVPRPIVRVPMWDELAMSPIVASLRGMSGPRGDLARRIAWGKNEPLHGWSIDYVATPSGVRFGLTDLLDPCGFTYSSADPSVIAQGFRILPLQED